MGFPVIRMRRLRKNENLRRMVRETTLSVDNLIYPLFVTFGKGIKDEIGSMPGTARSSIDMLSKEIKEVNGLGIPAVILFGIPEKKDDVGSEAYNPNGIVQRAIKEIKSAVPDLLVITDVCIDEYTSHGHCGVVKGNEILNDPTLKLLSKMAVTHAKAGADMVAPSDMMDGRVGAIRKALDEKDEFNVPVAAYNVSGEYSMVKAAAEKGWVDGEKIMMEILLNIKRAGADMILTYFAKDAAKILNR